MKVSKTISRRMFLKISAATGIAAMLAACGKKKPNLPTPFFTSTLKAAPPEPRLWPDWNRGDVSRNRTLKINSYVDGNRICNPLHESFFLFGGRGLLLEPCAYYSALQDKTILWLVDHYRYNKDAKELIIAFRKDITWSDGTHFTSGDMKFAIDALMRYQDSQLPAFFLRKANSLRAVVDSVELLDETSLKINFVETDWRFFQRELTFSIDGTGQSCAIVPSHIFQYLNDAELRNYEFFDGKKNFPVVTGPYLEVNPFDSYHNQYPKSPINQLELLPDWWAVRAGLVEKLPEVERVLIINYDGEKTKAELLSSREFDLSEGLETKDIQNLVFDKPFISTWTGDKPPYGYLAPAPVSLNFNCQKPPFDDPKVRWAVAYAIDQEMIAKKLWDTVAPGMDPEVIPSAHPGEFTPRDFIASLPFPPLPGWVKLYNQIRDLTALYNYTIYDQRQTVTLMGEAGFTRDADGYWRDPKGLRPDAHICLYFPGLIKLASLIQDQLQQAGFTCEVLQPDNGYLVAAQGYAPLFLDWNTTSANDPYEAFKNYRKETALPLGQESFQNMIRWYSDKFTAVVEKMRLTPPDGPDILSLFRKAMEIWYENLPFIPIYNQYWQFTFSQAYWGNWPTADNPYIEPHIVNYTMPQWVTKLKALF